MGFKKGASPKDVAVTVPAPWKSDGEYTFFFTRKPSREAVNANREFFGMSSEERTEEERKALVRAVAALSTREPEGFDDFPAADGDTSLAERFVAYFDDESEPDFQKILLAAWNHYIVEGSPRAYFKSGQDRSAGSGQPSGVPVEVTP